MIKISDNETTTLGKTGNTHKITPHCPCLQNISGATNNR